MSSSRRLRWPGRALPVTTTPLIIAGCAGRWTRPPAPARPPRPPARLGRPARAAAWAELLASAAQLAPVLVHGDIHEDQLLADGDRLTGIIDWETARVDYPFWDFDLGEWGTGLWRRRGRDFSTLWARAWRAYAQARGLETGSGPLETAFRLRHALSLLSEPGDPAVLGTVQEHLAHL
jgi:Ser/Thr protein kinase RdoA (MazF antagonist)